MTHRELTSDQILGAAGRLVLFASLLWVPMPFGSVTRASVVPLVLGPAVACALGLAATKQRSREPRISVEPYGLVWAVGGLGFIAFVALQLLPLPRFLDRLLSGESYAIWNGARSVHDMLDPSSAFRYFYPLTIDPPVTRLHLARLLGFFAAFAAGALLIRRRSHRVTLACVLGAAATFDVLYGLHQYAIHSRKIWGWPNLEIYNRVTGTFVNPNHFGHYLAIVLCVGLYLALEAWERSCARGGTRLRILARFLERYSSSAALGLVIMLVCAGGILVSQSRGALLAVAVGIGAILIARAIRERSPLVLPHRISESRRRRRRLAYRAGLVYGILLSVVIALVAWIGVDRTVRRFIPTPGQTLTLAGRTIGIKAAYRVWLDFPLFGSGFGTFDDVVLMTQDPTFDKIFSHAHNDYLEVLATTGVVGFTIAFVSLVLGGFLLARYAFAPDRTEDDEGEEDPDDGRTSRALLEHRVFAMCALAALVTSMTHALFDFNFYIPANALTLCAILGAAAAVPRIEHRIVERR